MNFDFQTFLNFAIHSSLLIMALVGNSESGPREIGAGSRLVKLPPLLAPAKISYSNTDKKKTEKVDTLAF